MFPGIPSPEPAVFPVIPARGLQLRRPTVFLGIPASEPVAAQADRNSELFLNYWRIALTEPEKEG